MYQVCYPLGPALQVIIYFAAHYRQIYLQSCPWGHSISVVFITVQKVLITISCFCSWPPGWQITVLQALLFIIEFYSVLYKFSSSVSKSIISHFSSSIQYHKCSLNKIEPKFNSWGSYAATGTEITEKGKLLCNIWNAVIYNYAISPTRYREIEETENLWISPRNWFFIPVLS